MSTIKLVARLFAILACALIPSRVFGAKILGVFPLPSKSHVILGSELLKGLARHGHEVTMLSSYPLQNPPANYHDIVIDEARMRRVYESTIMSGSSKYVKVLPFYSALIKLSDVIYEDDKVRALIESEGQQYDAIIYLQCNIDSLLGLSHKFNASSISFAALGVNLLSARMFGHPIPSAYVPNLLVEYGQEMTFWERFHNCMINVASMLFNHFCTDTAQRRLLQANFPDAPPLEDLRYNIDVQLVNSHIAIDSIRPTFQNMVNIGGYYMSNEEMLSKDVQKYLDSSKRGVIYFSFGSNLKSKNLDKSLVDQFLKYFASCPYDVLWNFDVQIANAPRNVKIVNWLPQRAVLNHPQVKVFITHGGKGSTNEAIYYGVPMVVIPFYSDQHMNAKHCAHVEIAVLLSGKDVTSDNLKRAIDEVMTNGKYEKYIKQRSMLIKDQEVDPMEKAVYWTEFVINNRGAKMLKSPAAKMPWYQLWSLDVMLVALGIALALLTTFVAVFVFVVKVICIRKRSISDMKNKNI